ncbi:hypothetical protein DRE_00136 [Drechslerella stenobrocha 248]|uniref:Uncharacterized protein n=1 Tax=Drechslerella stenobrocha 248 TaxID=1043628 RepID=W7HXA1_9PEZI|nr:hypothetical protein DRE_00136 [Drechslerella stenobrocha 248]
MVAPPEPTFSTGQTAQDIVQLRDLWDLSSAFEEHAASGWVPPAVLDPNYIAPVNLRRVDAATGAAFLVISTILVVWKIVATQRTRLSSVLFLEDWLLLAALVGQAAYVVVIWIANGYQIGWHVYDVRYHSVLKLYKFTGIWNIIIIWVYSTSRASLLVSIRRMYSPIKTKIKPFIDLLVAAKLVYLLVCVFALVFYTPRHPGVTFDLVASMRHEGDLLELSIRFMAAQPAFDTLLLICPFPLLWKLKHLPERRRALILWMCGLWATTMLAGPNSMFAYCESLLQMGLQQAENSIGIYFSTKGYQKIAP